MRSLTLTAFAAIALGMISTTIQVKAAQPDEKGKTCRMEQQCHWENFKKVCTYVKVCR